MTAINIRRTVDLNGAARLIQTMGSELTFCLLSEPGVGKTSVLKLLASMEGDEWRNVGDYNADDKFEYCYIDAPNKRDGDLFMPMPNRETNSLDQFTTAIINMNDPRPKMILIDEAFKVPKNMRPLYTRLYLERCLGDKKLPKGSRVIITSNNPEDGVSDFFAGHEADRVVFINVRKFPAEVWANGWATENGISAITRTCVMMNPRVMASYMDGVETKDNPIIFHPQTNPTRYASPRSIAAADAPVRNRTVLGEELTWAAVEGATNAACAQLLMSFIALEKELVDPRKPLEDPLNTPLPNNPAAMVLLMNNMIDLIKTPTELSNVMKYIVRSNSREVQSVFVSIATDNKRVAKLASMNADVQEWMKKNYRIAR